jgi:hypothetical protein
MMQTDLYNRLVNVILRAVVIKLSLQTRGSQEFKLPAPLASWLSIDQS